MTEKQFQSQVVDLARILGWLVYHTFDSRKSQPGFPDLVMVRDERVLFRELKTASGKLTEFQKIWGNRLQKAGADYAVWRPADLHKTIRKELQ